jgi:hypothetical protein
MDTQKSNRSYHQSSIFFALRRSITKRRLREQLLKCFTSSGIIPLQKDVIPDERYAPSTLFKLHGIEQTDSATEKSTVFHPAPMNRELKSNANEEPPCSKRTQEAIVREFMPTPEEKKSNEFEAPDFGWKYVKDDETLVSE